MTTRLAKSLDLDEYSDYAGKVCIWIKYNFYQGTCNAPTDGYLRDNPYSDDPVVFESVREALDWIEGETAGVYYARSGEYDPPTHYIVPADTAIATA
jgi:hypothetical protein